MDRIWRGLLNRYGQEVTLRNGGKAVTVRAFVQPILEQSKSQQTPSLLGLERQDRLRYLGPADCPLDLDTLVERQGTQYRVLAAHLAGEGICPHWWAVLIPGEEAAV